MTRVNQDLGSRRTGGLSRRELMQRVLAAVTPMAVLPLLEACSTAAPPASAPQPAATTASKPAAAPTTAPTVVAKPTAAPAVATFGPTAVTAPASAAATAQPQPGGVLRIGVDTATKNFDPHKLVGLVDRTHMRNTFRGLTLYDMTLAQSGVLKYTGDIAESYSVSPDGLTWTFQLRPGITFHDGRQLSVEDIKYSVDRIRDPETGSAQRNYWAGVDNVEISAPSTVRFHLKQPYALIPEAGIVTNCAIVPKDSAASLNTQPTGSGPFMFAQNDPGTRVVLKRFAGYWKKPLPYLDELQFISVPEESSRVAALQAGELDWIMTVPFARIDELKQDRNLFVSVTPSTEVSWLALNRRRPPLDQKLVRQAVAHAINRDAANKKALFGYGSPASTMVPPNSPVKVTADPLPYDPDRARSLIEQAGVKGFDLPILGEAAGNNGPTTESIAADLQAVGINARPVMTETGLWADQILKKKDFVGALSSRISTIDPHQRTYEFFGSDGASNVTGYADPAVDEALNKAVQESDPDKRAQMYNAIWKILIDDANLIAIHVAPLVIGMRANVKGFIPLPDQMHLFDTVWLDK